MPNSNLTSTLLTAAEAYFYLGWSVIPIIGDRDPTRAKVPAVPWSRFQHAHASLYEHNQWFTKSQFAGLGIVTGRISKLVILDFDAEMVYKAFCARYPDLIDTHTVLSAGRKLPHLYYRLPDHLNIDSMKGQGIDILSNGRYVVAPPTTISEESYKIIRGGIPKTLTERSIRLIQAFLAPSSIEGSLTPIKTPKKPLKAVQGSSKPYSVSQYDLMRLYDYHRQQLGRNEALFRTSLYARNTDWTPDEALSCLVPLHTKQVSTTSHHHETDIQRQREAFATIRSAFSKPSRSVYKTHPQGILPNSVREALMQQGLTYVIRTYEGLIQAGNQPGEHITAKHAVEQLKGLVGRDSVLKALKWFSLPVNPSKTAKAVATNPTSIESKKCFLGESKNQEKVKYGRPERVYHIPTNEDICNLLGVKITGSDVLETEDLASASKTRMALHRELIKRRPGQYSRRWLARRLGVTKRTLDAYNRFIPIHSRPMFVETSITWKTIERLPFDESIPGSFIETVRGKKYPALRGIASRLLSGGEGMTLKRQAANFYWYGDEEPLPTHLQIQQEVREEQERLNRFVDQKRAEMPGLVHKPNETYLRHSEHKQTLESNSSLLSMTQQEILAQLIYSTINQRSGKKISLANARRIVGQYSETHIRAALKLVQQRQKIVNPAGFFVIALRQ